LAFLYNSWNFRIFSVNTYVATALLSFVAVNSGTRSLDKKIAGVVTLYA